MKLKIELEKNETIEDADRFLAKAVQAKSECSGEERYADSYLNELEAHVVAQHKHVLKQIAEEVAEEIKRHADL